MRTPPRLAALGGIAALASSLFLGGAAVSASAAPAPVAVHAVAAVGDVCYGDLPSQAHDTQDLIDQGGPFPYKQDGEVFRNDEHLLPSQSSGYYHEYTVVTPGSSDRGARRIITGQQNDEEYYTSDHYASFDAIDFSC
ncbi:ribonuclease domain-containing protein [Streptomyces sp. NPDC047002]|uniref:ribonuclease domain-containing protein n=1 Tax=Streptomyces sp. NPDC047002 TaxID=3155475 RepID=UPI003452D663